MRFNTYLVCVAALGVLGGCHTAEHNAKKTAASLRLHLEANPGSGSPSEQIAVSRSRIMIRVEPMPFLTEENVRAARVIDVPGGFMLQIQFDRRGTWLLEQYSATNPGKHFAIYCQFGEKLKTGRWLSAPLIGRRIDDGVLTFTPHATREEADAIALGLNNVAAREQPKPAA